MTKIYLIEKATGEVSKEADINSKMARYIRLMAEDVNKYALYENIPQFPPDGFRWDSGQQSLAVVNLDDLVQENDAEAIEKKRQQRFREIENKLEIVTEAGVDYNGHTYQARENDLTRLDKELKHRALGGTPTPYWIDRDNNEVTSVAATDADLEALAVALGNYWKLCFSVRTDLKNEVRAASANTLLNYDVDARWNTVFAEKSGA